MLGKRYLSVFIAISLLWLVACQPKTSLPVSSTPSSAPATTSQGKTPTAESSLTATQHGLTVTLTDLLVSADQTSLDFVAQVDPVWGFTFGQYDSPPQQVFSVQTPSLADEAGHVYQLLRYQGGTGSEKFIDQQTGIAYDGGHLAFEPVTGSRLEITLPLALLTVRASEPIRFTVSDPNQNQSLSLNQQLVFGEMSTPIKSAEWKGTGSLEIAVDGSVQDENLMLICLYLYQDPKIVPPGYTGCSYEENTPADRTGTISFDPLPGFSQPVEVYAAADIVFLKPFRFTWIRHQQ